MTQWQILSWFIHVRLQLIELEIFLTDPSHRLPRVIKRSHLQTFFGEGWNDIMEDDTSDDAPANDNEIEDLVEDKGHMALLAVKKHWLATGLSKILPPGRQPIHLRKTLMTGYTGSSGCGSLKGTPGGSLLLATYWTAKQKSKILPFLAMVAIQEQVAANEYRSKMCRVNGSACLLRMGLREVLSEGIPPQNVDDSHLKQNVPPPGAWVFPDGIPDALPSRYDAKQRSLAELWTDLGQVRLLASHQSAITRIVQSIEGSQVSLLQDPELEGQDLRTAPVAYEVHAAVGPLVEVGIRAHRALCLTPTDIPGRLSSSILLESWQGDFMDNNTTFQLAMFGESRYYVEFSSATGSRPLALCVFPRLFRWYCSYPIH
jgi:hypothetical protein